MLFGFVMTTHFHVDWPQYLTGSICVMNICCGVVTSQVVRFRFKLQYINAWVITNQALSIVKIVSFGVNSNPRLYECSIFKTLPHPMILYDRRQKNRITSEVIRTKKRNTIATKCLCFSFKSRLASLIDKWQSLNIKPRHSSGNLINKHADCFVALTNTSATKN